MSRFCYSFDEAFYQGDAGDVEGAIIEALENIEDDGEGASFWIGESRMPAQPETIWSAEDWLDHVSAQDDYAIDEAMDWDESTKEQRAELETEVRAVMAKWLDKYRLRPTFFLVDKEVKYRLENGKVFLAPEVKADPK